MTDKAVLRSPLAAKTPGGALQMREVIGQTLTIVRGAADDEQFAAAFESALGCAPPSSFRRAAADGGRIIFRLGPDEWLVRDSEKSRETACADLQRALKKISAAAVNVSDYYTAIQIAGDGARDALAAGCPLDLHPRAFAAGEYAQSRFAVAAILLYQRDETPTFEVQTRWSFANYVWEYLCAAGGA